MVHPEIIGHANEFVPRTNVARSSRIVDLRETHTPADRVAASSTRSTNDSSTMTTRCLDWTSHGPIRGEVSHWCGRYATHVELSAATPFVRRCGMRAESWARIPSRILVHSPAAPISDCNVPHLGAPVPVEAREPSGRRAQCCRFHASMTLRTCGVASSRFGPGSAPASSSMRATAG